MIDFPEITEPPQAAAKAGAISAGITAVQGEVAKFDAIAAGLRELHAAHPKNAIVADIDTPAGMKLAEAGWRAWRNPRLEVERARKAAKAPVLALGKAIDTFAGDLETQLRAGEDHYKAQIDAEETRREQQRQEAARIEAERKAKHEAGIAKIRAYLTRCQGPGMTADRISIGIGMLEGVTFGPEWEEFAIPAANAQCETLEAMRKLHAEATEREAEAARLAEQRAELERQAAELAEARRVLAEQQAEAQRQADELRRKTQAEWDALQARIDAEAEAERKAAQAAAQNTEGQDSQQVLKAEPATADATACDAPADASPVGGPMGDGQPAAAGPAVADRVIAVDLSDGKPLPPQPEPATLSLGAIGDRLGFALPQFFIRVQLGIEPADNRGRAVLYRESQWAGIKAALVGYVGGLA